MFLRKYGSSGKYTFDIIYSALQKSLRRNDINLAMQMAYEFKEYPNALKKRLIQNCTEDCPDMRLILEIYNTNSNLNDLIKFIPVICNHIKCREAIMSFRVACEMELNNEPFNINDDMLTLLCKIRTKIIDDKEIEIFNFFQPLYPDYPLYKIYKFINKNRTFYYAITAYIYLNYVREDFKFKLKPNFSTSENLPDYVYDKHVRKSKDKSYKFFMENIVLSPRMPETELEKKGKELYISSNLSSGNFLKKQNIKSCYKKLDNNISVIQAQLVTAIGKQKVYFCDFDNNEKYSKILKGPFLENNSVNMQKFILTDQIKKIFGLHTLNYEIVYYKNNKYLLYENLINIEPQKTEIKTSKLEKNVKIYNGEKYFLNILKINDNQWFELLKLLLFRKVIGTNDTCDRNFIAIDNKIFSIDDPLLFKDTIYMFKKPLNEKLSNLYKQKLKTFFNDLLKIEDDWINKINNMHLTYENKSFMIEKINIFKDIKNWKF